MTRYNNIYVTQLEKKELIDKEFDKEFIKNTQNHQT